MISPGGITHKSSATTQLPKKCTTETEHVWRANGMPEVRDGQNRDANLAGREAVLQLQYVSAVRVQFQLQTDCGAMSRLLQPLPGGAGCPEGEMGALSREGMRIRKKSWNFLKLAAYA